MTWYTSSYWNGYLHEQIIIFDAWPRTTILCKKKFIVLKIIVIFSHKNNFLLWHLFCVSILIGVYFLLSILNSKKKKEKNYEIIHKKLDRVLWPWAYSYPTSCGSFEFPASSGIFCPIRIRYFQLVLENLFFLLC